jgi:GAF domain-containing protein
MIYAPPVTFTASAAQSRDEPAEKLAGTIELRSDDVAEALGELGHLLVAEESVDTTLQRVAELARRTIPGCDAAGVTLVNGRGYETVAWTDGRTIAVDQGQYERDHGPCLESIRTGRIVRVGVEAAAERWPDFAADARAHDIRSFLAGPLTLNGKGIGAINLYSRSADGFGGLDDALIGVFAAQATVALANAKVYREAVQLSQQLEIAIASRAVIEQAKGVLMARHGIDADTAFDRLRDSSQRRNQKLRDVAAEVVTSTHSNQAGEATPLRPRQPIR